MSFAAALAATFLFLCFACSLLAAAHRVGLWALEQQRLELDGDPQ